MLTTVGQALINASLPPDLRDFNRTLDKKGVATLFDDLARQHPEQYKAVAKRLSDVARDVAYGTGGFSFGLQHLREPAEATAVKAQLSRDIATIRMRTDLDDTGKGQAIVTALKAASKPLEDATFNASVRSQNPLAGQVASVGRGNKKSLQGLVSGDLLYEDQHGDPIPVPVLSSYAKGLKPSEYWAAGFGARRGVVDVKMATQQAGYLSKQLRQINHRLVVTKRDADDYDATSIRGLPVDVDDADNEGALLAHTAGTYGRNTQLTPKVLSDLKAQGVKRILVRSPTVGGPPEGGVYARDAGVRERGKLAPVGDFVGIAAADAIGEKLTQGQLCLAGGTLVSMADGSTKAIEEIQVGDVVLGANRAGKTAPAAVTATFDNGRRFCRRHRIGVAEVVCTPQHKILALNGGEQEPTPIGLCTWVRNVDGRAYICDVVGEHTIVPTYDIEVANFDHLFVLANGLIVSNSSKHAGGVAGGSAAVSGFAHINSLVQIPKIMPGGATHATKDGRVSAIDDAPQGGSYVTVAGETHYVPPGIDLAVKLGDDVEAGDVLSKGIPSDAEIVKYQGLGAGRAHFTQSFREAYRNAGMYANRRNVELLARGLIDHVKVTDEFGDHVPDDVVPYQAIEASWTPREGARHVDANRALGKYLERPVLHHTVGTLIKPSTLKDFAEFGVNNVLVHDDPPPFEPLMVRGMANLEHDPDWMTRHLGSNLQKSTLEAVHRGRTSDTAGTSWVPAVADRNNFGRHGLTQHWSAEDLRRDGDGDGFTGDGTPEEQRVRSSVLDGL